MRIFGLSRSGAKLSVSSKGGGGTGKLPVPQKQIVPVHGGVSGGTSEEFFSSLGVEDAGKLIPGLVDGLTLEEKFAFMQATRRPELIEYLLKVVPTKGTACVNVILVSCVKFIYTSCNISIENKVSYIMSILDITRGPLCGKYALELGELLFYEIESLDCFLKLISLQGNISLDNLFWFFDKFSEGKKRSEHRSLRIKNKLETIFKLVTNLDNTVDINRVIEYSIKMHAYPSTIKRLMGLIPKSSVYQSTDKKEKFLPGPSSLTVYEQSGETDETSDIKDVPPMTIANKLRYLRLFRDYRYEEESDYYFLLADPGFAKEFKLRYWAQYLFLNVPTIGYITGHDLMGCLDIFWEIRFDEIVQKKKCVASVLSVKLVSLTQEEKVKILELLAKMSVASDFIAFFMLIEPFDCSTRQIVKVKTSNTQAETTADTVIAGFLMKLRNLLRTKESK